MTAVSLVVAAAARAEPPPGQTAAAAERLFDEARALMAEKRYPEACAKFAASQRIDPGIGTLLNLAECYERRGLLASAWATLREAKAAATRESQPDRAEFAAERERALAPLLAHLTVAVTAGAKVDGLSIECDDVPLAEAAWGTAIPLDPGHHLVRARAPGREPWAKTVELPAQGALVVTIPVLPPHPPTGPQERAAGGGSARTILGYALGGLGVAAIGAGSFFGLRTFSEYRDADRHHCSPQDCDATGVSLIDDAKRDALVSTVFFAGGAAALAAGIFLVVTARGASSHVGRAAPSSLELSF